jgi:hypothetical protein
MEQTQMVSDPVDLTGKQGYPPKDLDIYETVILSPQALSPEASPSKEKGGPLDTVLVARSEEAMGGKRGAEPLVQGAEEVGRSESKDFDKAKKPRRETGEKFLEQTLLVNPEDEEKRG